ncbi:hypothetical protein Tco_0381636, partial [Tanacetum coccineum]
MRRARKGGYVDYRNEFGIRLVTKKRFFIAFVGVLNRIRRGSLFQVKVLPTNRKFKFGYNGFYVKYDGNLPTFHRPLQATNLKTDEATKLL